MNYSTFHFRYDERAEMFKLTQDNLDYITESEINAMLDDHEWEELTFVFIEHSTGFRTRVVNVNTDEIVLLEDLKPIAWDYYMRKLTGLSVEKAKRELDKSRVEIEKIRTNLNSKLEEDQHVKRFTKYNFNNRNNNKQSEKIAQ